MKNKILVLFFLFVAANASSQNWIKLKNESHDSIMILSHKIDSLTIVTDSMYKVIDGFSVVRNWMEKHLLDNYKDYSSNSFYELDTCLMDSLINIAGSVHSVKMDTLIQELYNSKKHLIQYFQFSKLIELEYDSIVIDSAQNQIKTIVTQCSELHKKQFEELLEKFVLYYTAINDIYEIVYDITYRVERYRKANDGYRVMRVAEEKFKSYEWKYSEAISNVPYTDSMYVNFQKAILEEPFEISEYEKKILSFESIITKN